MYHYHTDRYSCLQYRGPTENSSSCTLQISPTNYPTAIYKSSLMTAVVSLIRDGDDRAYRELIKDLPADPPPAQCQEDQRMEKKWIRVVDFHWHRQHCR